MDKRLIVSASQILQFLEGKLIIRYIIHAVQLLFDDDERGVQLDSTFNKPTDTYNREISFNGCPNCIITQLFHQKDDGVKVRFGEVKRKAVAEDHYLVNLDLLRLGTIGKNLLDSNDLINNLSLHIVGPYITFYPIELNADVLYAMSGLAHIRYPMSVSEVPAY